MTGIVLSAAVRQNLLSLQSTASLLATTQNDLATGNKVNSALDNPTNYFTAQSLNNRASDISNLLDGIGNGVQVLQAANTGLTSLQSLVSSAQSIASQALQTTVGCSSKSSFSVSLGAGATAATVNGSGQLVISTGTAADLSISASNAALLGSLGIGTGSATTSVARTPSTNSNLAIGTVLDVAAVGTGTATAITFGTGGNQISNLNSLNTALAANNLQATLDASGNLTIQTNNDNASQQIGALTGSTNLFAGKSASAPVVDPAAQAIRAGLVAQYNNILSQITTTAQDSSFNGVNLLNGDSLKLVFNETGTSTLNITGTTFNSAGLGLSNLTVGTDFIDNTATNKVLASLNGASNSLRSEASSLGSNLSIVQIRQDFSKNLINVLQTGSSNLTLADTNEEAANSQALSTRQSIAVSALALANQSQASVLQLLR